LLVELNIKNFAIIDDLNLRFSPGFNVLTGETGAGKSIIIDAVSTLLGGRAESEYIRAGTEESRVEGIFHLDEAMQAAILSLLEEDELEGEDDETLILAREIRRSGRNICRVNGRAVTLGTLERIAQGLVDIHGQSEHLSLLRVREHVNLLDRYANLWPLRSQVADKVSALRQVQRELKELLRDERELARRADLLEYQAQEIAAARLEVGEEEELGAERNRLANAERLTELTDEAYRALGEGEEGQASAIDLLDLVVRNLSSVEKMDPSLAERRQVAEEISYQLEDLVQSLRAYCDQIEFDPVRLRQVEERLDLIYSLKRKYGDSIEEVLAFGQAAQRELEAITHSEERVEELQVEEDRLLHEVGDLAAQLSAQRREAGDRLSAAIEAELADLNMERACFGVSIEQSEDADGAWVGDKGYAFDSTGIDRVEFLIAPNVGEPLKPMVKIASGGETSRLMLALKAILSAADETPTLIFDEIDQGIGGRAGGVVGYKLWKLSPKHQVLCVTHLPQLAGYGDTHYKVGKRVVGERTVASVQKLEVDGQLEELAQMLGTVTEVTRHSAQEILEEVRKNKERTN
jgi:DNA repair protein RecN (Recombination protein N)